MTRPGNDANYGIVGNVQAKAVAVGAGSSAVVNETTMHSRAEFDSALATLRDQIAALRLPESGREILDEDIARIAKMAGEKPGPAPAAVDVLKGLVEKLKMVGVLLQTAVGFREPIKKIAEWFHLTLPF